MYTLIPSRLLSVCSSDVGRSSWRGGAGIIKPWRGTSGTLLSAIRGSLQRVLILQGPVNVQPGLFWIGIWGRAWPQSPTHHHHYHYHLPHPLGCLLGLLILSQANTLSGMSCWALSQSRKWKSHVETPRGRQWGLNSHPFIFFPCISFIKSCTYIHNSSFVDQMTKPYICLLHWLRNCIFPKIMAFSSNNRQNKITIFIIVIAVISPLSTFIHCSHFFALKYICKYIWTLSLSAT